MAVTTTQQDTTPDRKILSVYSRAEGDWDIHVQEHPATQGYAATVSLSVQNVVKGTLARFEMTLPVDAALTLGDALQELGSQMATRDILAKGIEPVAQS